ncbi:response regulator [Elusimicrobiota bacterium]
MKTKNYSTVEISKFLDVAYNTVARWVDDGKLEAFKTPGGHRRVYHDNLKKFLDENNINLSAFLKSCSSESILVVDDEEKIRNYFQKIISKHFSNYTLYLADNGYEAGKCVIASNPCLVILDLIMPGIDGFAVCRDIKEMGLDIKVLAITGFDTPENKKKIMEAGADAYLTKPFEKEDLIEEINKLIKVPALI